MRSALVLVLGIAACRPAEQTIDVIPVVPSDPGGNQSGDAGQGDMVGDPLVLGDPLLLGDPPLGDPLVLGDPMGDPLVLGDPPMGDPLVLGDPMGDPLVLGDPMGDPLVLGDPPKGDPLVLGDPSGGDACGNRCTWWDVDWQRRIPIDVVNSESESFSLFPLRVTLDDSVISYAHTQNSGDDLRFVDDAGAVLPHEIELWQGAGSVSEVWVAVELAPNSTERIWLYYDNASAPTVEDPATVWSDNFLMVLHLDETATDELTTGAHLDSTANDNHGVQVGNESQPGFIGIGQELDGDNAEPVPDHIVLPTNLSNGVTNFTIEAWVGWAGLDDFERIVDFNNGPADPDNGAYLYVTPRTNNYEGNGEFYAAMSLAGWRSGYGVHHTPMTSAWTHVAVVQIGTTLEVYYDGALQASGLIDATVTLATIAADNHWLGRSAFGSEDPNFGGILDEVRFSPMARSAAWIAAQHDSMTGAMTTVDVTEVLDP